MRIISGQYRGRRLSPPRLKFTRPTTDFAREGIFNILNNRISWDGMDILDLYSGTGAMSFEFLSRGVNSAIAIDNQIDSVKFISETKLNWKVENLEVIKADALKYLEKCHITFDLIFADPPYHTEDHEDIIRIVFEKKLLKPEGYLVLEHHKNINFESKPYFDSHRNFGNVKFSIFCPSNN